MSLLSSLSDIHFLFFFKAITFQLGISLPSKRPMPGNNFVMLEIQGKEVLSCCRLKPKTISYLSFWWSFGHNLHLLLSLFYRSVALNFFLWDFTVLAFLLFLIINHFLFFSIDNLARKGIIKSRRPGNVFEREWKVSQAPGSSQRLYLFIKCFPN